MKKIKLTQHKIAFVDDEDFERVNAHKWQAMKRNNTFYAKANVTHGSKTTTIMMHRFILNTPEGFHTDHKDGNGLHNWKSNLRPCTQSQNNANSAVPKNNKTGYKGVRWSKANNKWVAEIGGDFIGYYADKDDAARAYNQEAISRYGEFARPNVVLEPNEKEEWDEMVKAVSVFG